MHGKPITGDGVIFELSGSILDILTPNTHPFISLDSLKGQLLKFKVASRVNYELLVYAYGPKTNNTGLDRINFVIQ